MLNGATTLIQVVVGDSKYQINFTLQDSNAAVVVLNNLSSLTFKAQLESDAAVQFTGAMTVVSAPAGTCYYQPVSTDFPVAGAYNCQIVVLYTSGEQITFDNIQVTAGARVPQ